MVNGKILLIQVLAVLGYTLFLSLTDLPGFILSFAIIVLHTILNFILFLSYFERDKTLSRTYLLAMFLVPLVGYSSCAGIANMIR